MEQDLIDRCDVAGFEPLIIDSGAKSAVCGAAWIRKWFSIKGVDAVPSLTPSQKVYKFGDSRKFCSMGYVELHGIVPIDIDSYKKPARELITGTDVVDTGIPPPFYHAVRCIE